MSITSTMQQHHKHCDDLFVAAESACANADWAAALGAFLAFRRDLEDHLAGEEDILFPAFEAATGMHGGPTQVMRLEHRQMRDLVDEMQRAIETRDGDRYAGAADTLLILMQQHNLKEENILYPMTDRALGSSVLGALEQHLGLACPA